MRDGIMRRFEKRLLQLGCPTARVSRKVAELADHYDDLKRDAMEVGLSEADADARARDRIGDPVLLAEQAAFALRQSSWWGRHPVIAFGFLPPLAVFSISLLVPLLLLALLKSMLPAETWFAAADGGAGFRAIQFLLAGSYYGAMVFGVSLFCWLSRQSVVAIKWTIIVGLICSLHGCFGKVIVRPHTLTIGYGPYPNFYHAAVPLLIALAVFIWYQRREGRRTRDSSDSPESGKRLTAVLSSVVGLLIVAC